MAPLWDPPLVGSGRIKAAAKMSQCVLKVQIFLEPGNKFPSLHKARLVVEVRKVW